MRITRRNCGAVLGAIVLLMSGARCSADRVILGSNTDTLNAGVLRREVVSAEGSMVECWVARSGAPKRQGDKESGRQGDREWAPEAIVVFFPGQRARAEPWTQMVADAWGVRAVEVWGVNFPGYGGSTAGGLKEVTPAALAVVDAARVRWPGKKVYVQGASFGAAVSLAVGARRELAGMILQNPPPLRELLMGRYGWWNLWMLAWPVSKGLPEELDALANARAAKAPAVFIVSSGDGVVPISYQRRVVETYAGQKRIVENAGAGHSDGLSAEAVKGVAAEREWLWGK